MKGVYVLLQHAGYLGKKFSEMTRGPNVMQGGMGFPDQSLAEGT
jgi:hypothetical protein